MIFRNTPDALFYEATPMIHQRYHTAETSDTTTKQTKQNKKNPRNTELKGEESEEKEGRRGSLSSVVFNHVCRSSYPSIDRSTTYIYTPITHKKKD